LPWLVLAAVAGAAAGGYWLYQQRTAAAERQAALAALRTETVARGDIVARVSATGSILPEQQADLFFLTPGTVAEVLVETGDVVRAGQVVARLDATPQLLALQQARDALTMAELNRDKLLAGPTDDDVAVARANLRSANAAAGDLQAGAGEEEVAIAQIRYDSAQADYRKLNEQYNALVQFRQDYPMFAPPQDAVDSLKANMEQAYYAAEVASLQLAQAQQGAGRGQLSVAYAQILQAKAVLSQTLALPTDLQRQQADLAVEQARAQVERAELQLDRTELRAPYGGVIAAVGARVGEPAVPTIPAMALLDASRFHLDVLVDEVDVAQLAAEQPVTVLLEALPDSVLSGRVDRLAPTAATANGVVNYTVRLVLEPTEAPLRAGMSATAEIVVAAVRTLWRCPTGPSGATGAPGRRLPACSRAKRWWRCPLPPGCAAKLTRKYSRALRPGTWWPSAPSGRALICWEATERGRA
jgi:HlyD family secretion protein